MAELSRVPGSAARGLLHAARDLLERYREAATFLAAFPAPDVDRPVEPRSLPVLRWLDAARSHTVPATAPLVDALAEAASSLAWGQTYVAADLGPAFLQNYGWTELMGLRGPVPSPRIACGMLILGPDTDYPAHAHQAEELYLPLAGTALWRRGPDAPVARPPGLPIHHPAWMPHAMCTGAEPLLALYLWQDGDLAAKSRFVV